MLKTLIKISRVQNLIIIAATQYIMRFFIVRPMLAINDFELQFSEFNFFLLVLATVMLAAAGYFINDYFDVNSDSINKPKKVGVGKTISRKSVMTIHLILNAIAVIIGFYISVKIGIYKIGFIFILIAGLLWFYSSSYKKEFLIGNIVIALLSALVPFIVVVYEVPLLNREYLDILLEYNYNFNSIIFWILGFTFFAFITSLIREIIKDVEDIEGDIHFGGSTVPIIIGTLYTKIIIISLIVITITALFFAYFKYITDYTSLVYMIVALILPLIFLIYKIIIAKNKKHYHFASVLIKIIMILGISYAFVAFYNFSNII